MEEVTEGAGLRGAKSMELRIGVEDAELRGMEVKIAELIATKVELMDRVQN